MRRRYFLLLGMRRNRTSPMTSTKGDQTMRKPKENVKEIGQPSKQLIKEKTAAAMVVGLDPLTYFECVEGGDACERSEPGRALEPAGVLT
jgi:hypothetical protein